MKDRSNTYLLHGEFSLLLIYICIHIYILNEWMCNTAREIDAAAQPLSHSGRAADAATQPLWVTEWLSGWRAIGM